MPGFLWFIPIEAQIAQAKKIVDAKYSIIATRWAGMLVCFNLAMAMGRWARPFNGMNFYRQRVVAK
ncbi:MAG: hypothetical protein ACKVZH_01465 [Blastocatellia bacterium]